MRVCVYMHDAFSNQINDEERCPDYGKLKSTFIVAIFNIIEDKQSEVYISHNYNNDVKYGVNPFNHIPKMTIVWLRDFTLSMDHVKTLIEKWCYF